MERKIITFKNPFSNDWLKQFTKKVLVSNGPSPNQINTEKITTGSLIAGNGVLYSSMQKRILVICQHFYPEMVSTGLLMTELCVGLAQKQENQVYVYCAYPDNADFISNNLQRTEKYKNLFITRVKNLGTAHGSVLSRTIFGLTFVMKSIAYAVRVRKKYDLIIVTTNPPYIGLVPILAKKIFRKKFILITADIYPEIAIQLDVIKKTSLITKLWCRISNMIFNYADKIVVLGGDMQKVVEGKVKPAVRPRIQIIQNWSDSAEVNPIQKDDNIFIKEHHLQGKSILLYSGNLGRTHNIEPILEAAYELRDNTSIVFIIVGNGYKKKLVENFIVTHGLTNILSLPYQPFEKLAHVLSSATISFVCLDDKFTGYSVPSKAYGIMASAKPIIGLLSDDSEIAQTITKFKCGFVFNSKSSESLTNIILSAINNADLLSQMSQNAHKAFMENFDLKIAIGKYEKLISEVA